MANPAVGMTLLPPFDRSGNAVDLASALVTRRKPSPQRGARAEEGFGVCSTGGPAAREIPRGGNEAGARWR